MIDQFRGRPKKLWLREVLLVLLASVFLAWYQWDALLPFVVGAVIFWINIGLFEWGAKRAHEHVKVNPKQAMLLLYVNAVLRFIMVGVMFVFAIKGLDLAPLPMVGAFILLQFQMVFGLLGKQRLTD